MYLYLLQHALLKLDKFSSLCCAVSPDVTIAGTIDAVFLLETYSPYMLFVISYF